MTSGSSGDFEDLLKDIDFSGIDPGNRDQINELFESGRVPSEKVEPAGLIRELMGVAGQYTDGLAAELTHENTLTYLYMYHLGEAPVGGNIRDLLGEKGYLFFGEFMERMRKEGKGFYPPGSMPEGAVLAIGINERYSVIEPIFRQLAQDIEFQ
ncbi:hypothetical protein JXB11_03260 [Candidatus Woesearchaeota archaeon]|nr:hypothetical protein [Candidatus Woesearchaeota archaeon]